MSHKRKNSLGYKALNPVKIPFHNFNFKLSKMSWSRVQRAVTMEGNLSNVLGDSGQSSGYLSKCRGDSNCWFFEHATRGCLADCFYRVNYITIGRDPYVGIFKCLDKDNTPTGSYIPLASCHNIVKQALQMMTYPPVSTQHEVNEKYHCKIS